MNAATGAVDTSLPLFRIEEELTRRHRLANDQEDKPTLRARLSNLVVYCQSAAQADIVTAAIPEIVAAHPARVLLLVGGTTPDEPLQASLHVWRQTVGKHQLCSEQVTLRASGRFVDQLPFAMRQLVIGDLPTNLWWCCNVPPPLAGNLLFDLGEHAQQIIYDSNGWMEPARGVLATGDWLPKVHLTNEHRRWRVAADLNWRRLKVWRRMLSQALDPNIAPGALDTISEVLVEHGPHAVVQAWELVSWLAARLGWKVRQGTVQPGVEIEWQAESAHGEVMVRVRRLTEGPSEIRSVRVCCQLNGEPHPINIALENGKQLAVALEGLNAAPRTVSVKQPTMAELISKQLSDRERDPVFQESMSVAAVFARSVLE